MRLTIQNQTRERRRSRRGAGYLMNEALVYISVVFVVLGVGYAAMYRCVANSVALRRSADDITAAVRAGERWRADVRSAGRQARLETVSGMQVLRLVGPRTDLSYAFMEGSVVRRVGAGAWVPVVKNVKSSEMQADPRREVAAWKWELELQPRLKTTRIRPLFSFAAVPEKGLP